MLLIDFSNPGSAAHWVAVNDGVMGGVSTGRIVAHDGCARFEGSVSLANDGGFASVRTRGAAAWGPGAWPELARRGVEAFELAVRGDGKRYRLTLRTDDGFDAIQYQASFTVPLQWRTLRLPVGDFRPRFRGRDVPGAPALDARRVSAIGLLIADRQAGPFRLDIQWIGVSP